MQSPVLGGKHFVLWSSVRGKSIRNTNNCIINVNVILNTNINILTYYF